MKVFISYAFDDENSEYEWFAHRVAYYLYKQTDLDPYCYSEERSKPNWRDLVGPQIMKECERFVLIVGKRLGGSQEDEARAFVRYNSGSISSKAICFKLPGAGPLPDGLFPILPISIPAIDDHQAQECARKIVEVFSGPGRWIANDGVPIGYPFDYEKDIVEDFLKGRGSLLTPRRVEQGCPRDWPEVKSVDRQRYDNPFMDGTKEETTLGIIRPPGAAVRVDTRSPTFLPDAKPLTFPEAGPRKELCYPSRGATLRIGIVVSGGIAPGINAVIAGIVERHRLYAIEQGKKSGIQPQRWSEYRLDVVMYREGFTGLLRGKSRTYSKTRDKDELRDLNVQTLADRGGSMISTSRCDDLLGLTDRKARDELLNAVVARILGDYIDILYVIGGDGSLRAAHAIWTRASAVRGTTLSVVGIPKTTDNDVLWVWQSFGFLSAIEKAKELTLQLYTEVTSNPRLCVIQLFGSDSGFVVSHVALASGVCMAALIPEVEFSMDGLSRYIREKQLTAQDWSMTDIGPHGLIVMAETAIPQDVEDYIDNPKYPDLGLEEKEKEAIRKFVGSSLLKTSDIQDWRKFCETLLQGIEGSGQQDPATRVWECLPVEIRGLIQHAEQVIQQEVSLQALIVKALNDVLKRADFFQDKYFSKILESEPGMKSLLSLTLRLCDSHNPLTPQEFQRFDEEISEKPLSSDARGLGCDFALMYFSKPHSA
ncbi:MAG: 6-phosphofructokinase [Deltaproteobacteria bacterium]|nr:6-phosphofructokinase [Deltaproteobacteria bacterium]